MKLFVQGYGSMRNHDWFVSGEIRETKKQAEADLRTLKAQLKGVADLQKENARLREVLERIAGYSMSQFPNRTAMIIEMHHVANDALGIKRGE